MSYFYKYVYFSVNGERSDDVSLQEAEKGDENDEEKTKEWPLFLETSLILDNRHIGFLVLM